MDIGWLDVLLSTALILVAVVLSVWKGFRAERSILWSALRAAVQLLVVGLLFRLIFESASAMTWAWVWVVGMVIVSAEVVKRRAPGIPMVRAGAYAALGGALVVCLGIVFGLRVFDLEPVTFVVVAGITLGNTMPSAVLAVDVAARAFTENPGRIEGALALGMDSNAVNRLISPEAVRAALIPQIERTKVVGLIALPGAMTGMLLAGADPFSAVLVQLVIMYLILGAVAIAVVTVVTLVGVRAFTADGRLEEWVRTQTR
jgi:putative ABC transport system permease protein